MSYSDGCCGQNKNLTITGFYNEMHRNRVYERINHKYLGQGHTYLENDRDFSGCTPPGDQTHISQVNVIYNKMTYMNGLVTRTAILSTCKIYA